MSHKHFATRNGFVRVEEMFVRCQMLRGPSINDPSSGEGIRCLISHDKWKISLDLPMFVFTLRLFQQLRAMWPNLPQL